MSAMTNGYVMSSEDPKIAANAEQKYQVTKKDLPLSCPMPNMALWNSHPKVYLPIEKTGKASCPYCGSEYTLVSD